LKEKKQRGGRKPMNHVTKTIWMGINILMPLSIVAQKQAIAFTKEISNDKLIFEVAK